MLPTERRRCLSLLLPPCLALLLLLLQPHSSVAPGGDLRGGSPQWLGRKKDARTVTVRPGDEDTASNMARAFERGEGGLMGADPTHGGRGDHTELLDLADYTKKKKHPRERTRAVPKGFHMPGERKDDGVRGPRHDPPVHGTASSVSHTATPRNALCASAAHCCLPAPPNRTTFGQWHSSAEPQLHPHSMWSQLMPSLATRSHLLPLCSVCVRTVCELQSLTMYVVGSPCGCCRPVAAACRAFSTRSGCLAPSLSCERG